MCYLFKKTSKTKNDAFYKLNAFQYVNYVADKATTAHLINRPHVNLSAV